MKKISAIALTIVLLSLSVFAQTKLNNLTYQEFAARQTEILKDKLNPSETVLLSISAINLEYAKQTFALCDNAKDYAASKKAFYNLVEEKRNEMLKVLPQSDKEFYSSIEDKFKILTWKNIKQVLRSKGIK